MIHLKCELSVIDTFSNLSQFTNSDLLKIRLSSEIQSINIFLIGQIFSSIIGGIQSIKYRDFESFKGKVT